MNGTTTHHMKNAVAYYRASTKSQGKSGLGIEAQKEDVKEHQRLFNIHIEREYVDILSGKRWDRRELKKAIRYCKKANVSLLFANMDRLARDALFVATLILSKVDIVAVDKPNATILDLLEDAIRAQREGEIISKRTKMALQAAKRRGVLLGTFGKVLAERNKMRSIEFAIKMQPIINRLKEGGFISVQSLTDELNKRKVPTYRPRSKWHKSTVHKLLSKIALISQV